MASFNDEAPEVPVGETDQAAPHSEESAAKKESSGAAKIAKAEALKEAGNEQFKVKAYAKAITRFSKVRAYTWEPTGEAQMYAGTRSATAEYTDAEKAQLRRLDLIACGNIAAAYLALGEPRKALDYCSKVLAAVPEPEAHANCDLVVKALCRAAQAHLLHNDLDAAKALVLRALTLDAACAPARQVYKQLQLAYKQHTENQKRTMKAAFA
ncbi:hypothetical protein M885DRAFT_520184 [Pelagophyceae sp. CCMP2097]|nr:hypothetical protein M885DRAFT_520184 [Pelagophyceae sp. CCMP2097]|mmetsp:Transcript_626/g.2037  ORF Transcript_626/g.2037 Transcript_626/m.2037 type:complete len:211 (-) Transcript_626:322-954(-)